MKALFKIYKIVEKGVPGLIFCSIFIIMLMEIFSRLLFRKSFEWNTEYCRYALVWIAFLGSVYVRRENAHIKVMALYDYFVKRGHVKIAYAMDVFCSLFSLGFYTYLGVYGYKLATVTARFGSSAMGLSQYWLYLCTALAGIFGFLLEAGTLILLVRAGFRGDFLSAQTKDGAEGV